MEIAALKERMAEKDKLTEKLMNDLQQLGEYVNKLKKKIEEFENKVINTKMNVLQVLETIRIFPRKNLRTDDIKNISIFFSYVNEQWPQLRTQLLYTQVN